MLHLAYTTVITGILLLQLVYHWYYSINAMQRRKMQHRENATGDCSAQCANRTASFPCDPTSLDIYLHICVLRYHLTYSYPCSFGSKENICVDIFCPNPCLNTREFDYPPVAYA